MKIGTHASANALFLDDFGDNTRRVFAVQAICANVRQARAFENEGKIHVAYKERRLAIAGGKNQGLGIVHRRPRVVANQVIEIFRTGADTAVEPGLAQARARALQSLTVVFLGECRKGCSHETTGPSLGRSPPKVCGAEIGERRVEGVCQPVARLLSACAAM